MPDKSPIVVIRAGSHAEKEYLLKLAPFIDGLTVGANLFEATPGATASLLLKVSAKNKLFYIDPMTYAYGAYVDPQSGLVRTDLDWIKSDQVRKDKHGKKVPVRAFKKSYRKLSEIIGPPLSVAVEKSTAIDPADFGDENTKRLFCRSVGEYQLKRVAQEFEGDDELQEFADAAPTPSALFAPYFYVEPHRTNEWLNLNLELMTLSAGLGLGGAVHGVVCADVAHLTQPEVLTRLIEELPATGVSGVWLWFSRFFEDSADEATLREYKRLIRALSGRIEVYAMRGGFFSLALSKFGLRGIGHGVGYGEQKDVVPIIGQSIPTVNYYLPSARVRLRVPDIERAFDSLGIVGPNEFHNRVCGCAVCRGVVVNSIDDFSEFGDRRYSRPDAKRPSQTPDAAKRCRFHFLLTRIAERERIRSQSADEIAGDLEVAAAEWGAQPSLSRYCSHLLTWSQLLRNG